MRRPRSRRWTAPPRSCPCCPGPPSGPPTTTPATGPPTCTPPWMSPPARSSPSCPPPPRHRVQAIPGHLDRSVPADLGVHLICDNSSTHKTPRSSAGCPPTPAPAAFHPDRQFLAEPGGALVCRADHQVAQARQPPVGGRARAGDPGLDRGLEPAATPVRVDQTADEFLDAIAHYCQRINNSVAGSW